MYQLILEINDLVVVLELLSLFSLNGPRAAEQHENKWSGAPVATCKLNGSISSETPRHATGSAPGCVQGWNGFSWSS